MRNILIVFHRNILQHQGAAVGCLTDGGGQQGLGEKGGEDVGMEGCAVTLSSKLRFMGGGGWGQQLAKKVHENTEKRPQTLFTGCQHILPSY